ncbi:MAG: RNA-binding S4 domain-containing protein [Bacteroidota bacterium]|jgi:ribosome-associated heat shock protein Hsp15
MSETARIDKFLWAVRIFKTRGLASEACELEKVKIKGVAVKPSRNIHAGELFSVRFGAFERQFKVIAVVKNRQSAAKVPAYCQEITPNETLDAMRAMAAQRAAWREPGLGRPTKKERRELDEFMDWDDW